MAEEHGRVTTPQLIPKDSALTYLSRMRIEQLDELPRSYTSRCAPNSSSLLQLFTFRRAYMGAAVVFETGAVDVMVRRWHRPRAKYIS